MTPLFRCARTSGAGVPLPSFVGLLRAIDLTFDWEAAAAAAPAGAGAARPGAAAAGTHVHGVSGGGGGQGGGGFAAAAPQLPPPAAIGGATAPRLPGVDPATSMLLVNWAAKLLAAAGNPGAAPWGPGGAARVEASPAAYSLPTCVLGAAAGAGAWVGGKTRAGGVRAWRRGGWGKGGGGRGEGARGNGAWVRAHMPARWWPMHAVRDACPATRLGPHAPQRSAATADAPSRPGR